MSLLDSTRQNDFTHLRKVVDDVGTVRMHLAPVCMTCSEVGLVPITGGKTTLTQEWAEKTVAKAGWWVGKTRQKDLCPVCAVAERNARQITRVAVASENNRTLRHTFTPTPTKKIVLRTPLTAYTTVELTSELLRRARKEAESDAT